MEIIAQPCAQATTPFSQQQARKCPNSRCAWLQDTMLSQMDEVNIVMLHTQGTCAPANQIIAFLITSQEISTLGSKYQSNAPHVIASPLSFILSMPSNLSLICLFSPRGYFSSRLFKYLKYLILQCLFTSPTEQQYSSFYFNSYELPAHSKPRPKFPSHCTLQLNRDSTIHGLGHL